LTTLVVRVKITAHRTLKTKKERSFVKKTLLVAAGVATVGITAWFLFTKRDYLSAIAKVMRIKNFILYPDEELITANQDDL
jgi:hypothetical protein